MEGNVRMNQNDINLMLEAVGSENRMLICPYCGKAHKYSKTEHDFCDQLVSVFRELKRNE